MTFFLGLFKMKTVNVESGDRVCNKGKSKNDAGQLCVRFKGVPWRCMCVKITRGEKYVPVLHLNSNDFPIHIASDLPTSGSFLCHNRDRLFGIENNTVSNGRIT